MDLDALLTTSETQLHPAIQAFWDIRDAQYVRQHESGQGDAGSRGAVTGGRHMQALEAVIVDLIDQLGLPELTVRVGKTAREGTSERQQLELPGYYRPEKQWDMIVLARSQLVAAIEFKAQVGPSFGNNINNRTEEALGSAEDIWKAYREGRFGNAPAPFLGYVFVLEDCPAVHMPIRVKEPFFDVDPIFKGEPIPGAPQKYRGVSYGERYSILCQRLRLERFYTATCLLLTTRERPTMITQPHPELAFRRFLATLVGHMTSVVLG